MPYSPIHDDDICAQLEPLLGAASVPATIVNWGGDEPVSVQEWSRYFGELLGVDVEVARRSRSRRVDRIGRRPHQAHVDHRAVPGGLARRVPRMAEQLYPDRVQATDERCAVSVARTAARGGGATEAGLADFGPGDFREGLGVLLESLERDGDLDPATDVGVVGDLRRRLVNRLEVEAWYVEHPEVDDVPVRGPVDINGLPRTGTTALANMLSLDPQFRCLRGWEQAKPCPPPSPTAKPTDPRRLAARPRERAASAETQAMHLYEVDATMEDTELLGHGVPRPAVHAAGVRLPRVVAQRRLDRHLRVPPAGREAAGVATPAGPVAVQGAAPQLPPRGDLARPIRTCGS